MRTGMLLTMDALDDTITLPLCSLEGAILFYLIVDGLAIFDGEVVVDYFDGIFGEELLDL